MSKILRRPMFRGGQVDSRGTGITSGLGYQAGGRVGYKSAGFVTGGELMDLAQTFPELNKFKNMTINPYTKFKIGEGKMIGSPSGKFEGKFDVDRVASFRGTPGMQDLAFLLPGEAYNLSTSLGGDKKKDDNELIVSKDPNFIPNKNENITVDDDMSFDIDKERSNRIALEESERMQKNQLSELLKDMSKNEQYEKDIGAQRKETVDQYPDAGVNTVPKNEIEVKESFEDDGTEMGFQGLADQYYKTLSAGADERLQARIDAAEAKADKKISRARKTDAFNTMLKFFEGSQQEGATVGSAAAEASKYLTSKPSATELAMDKKDIRLEQIEDAGFNREEATRVQAGAFAFKDLMQEKGFDFKKELQKSGFDFTNVKSEKDFNNQMKLLNEKLNVQKDIANKNLILSLKKLDTAGQYEKKVDQIIQDRFGGDESKRAEASRIALGDAGTIEIAVYDATQGGMPITDKAFDLLATEYTDGPMPEGDLAGVSGVFYIPGEMQIVTVVEGVVDKSKTKNFKP
jgi:hypothetical protein